MAPFESSFGPTFVIGLASATSFSHSNAIMVLNNLGLDS